MTEKRDWIPDAELADVVVKWSWSHFDGREDVYNTPGDHNFTISLPEDIAKEMASQGWNVREREGREEGDPPEWTLECKISDKFGVPPIFFIKRGRKFRIEALEELREVRRDSCSKLNVILQPSPWTNGMRSGITAYVKEMYVEINESRFAAEYADFEEV